MSGTTTPPAVTGPYTPPAPRTSATPKETEDLFSSKTFLRLLAGQMQNQNPLEPMKDQEFLGQMAQFSSLEQMTNLNATMGATALATQLAQRSAMIGREVTWAQEDGTTASGLVTGLAIDPVERTMRLDVGGTLVDPTTVVRVDQA